MNTSDFRKAMDKMKVAKNPEYTPETKLVAFQKALKKKSMYHLSYDRDFNDFKGDSSEKSKLSAELRQQLIILLLDNNCWPTQNEASSLIIYGAQNFQEMLNLISEDFGELMFFTLSKVHFNPEYYSGREGTSNFLTYSRPNTEHNLNELIEELWKQDNRWERIDISTVL